MKAMEILSSLNMVLNNQRTGKLQLSNTGPDPIPAGSGESIYLPSWRPGTHAPDPVRARSI